MDAAEHVFSQKGYANAAFQEIAESVGLSRGAIYWHFSDKDQLLDAVLRRTQLPWERLPEQFASRSEMPSLDELCEDIGDALNEIVSDPRQYRITLTLLHRTELVADNHQVLCRLIAILERIKSYLVAAFTWLYRTSDGKLHRNIPTAATAVKALLTGMVFEWLLNQAE